MPLSRNARTAAAWLLTRALGLLLLGHPIVLASRQADVRGDLFLYVHYARELQAGLLPYRDFALEYPPANVILELIPASSESVYIAGFLLCALLADALTAWMMRRDALSTAIWIALPVLLGPIVWARLDIFVAVVFVAAVRMAQQERWASAASLIAVAGLLKLWPLALLLILLPAVPSQARRRFVLSGALVVVAVLGPLLALGAGSGLLLVLQFHSARGIEIESVAALPGHIRAMLHHGPSAEALFGCFQFEASSTARLMLTVGLCAALACSMYLARRLAVHGFAAAMVAPVLLTTVTSKVLSPQYLVWVAASVAVVAPQHPLRRTVCVLLSGVLLTSQCLFPFLFFGLYDSQPLAVAIAFAHALLLIMLTGALLLPLIRSASRSPATEQRELEEEQPPLRSLAITGS